VGVLELGRDVDLALEAVDAHPGRHLGREDLHDDWTLEPHLLGEEDAAHPAAAELALDGVSAAKLGLQLLAEFGRHAPLLGRRQTYVRSLGPSLLERQGCRVVRPEYETGKQSGKAPRSMWL
jgi:hypothetical protein